MDTAPFDLATGLERPTAPFVEPRALDAALHDLGSAVAKAETSRAETERLAIPTAQRRGEWPPVAKAATLPDVPARALLQELYDRLWLLSQPWNISQVKCPICLGHIAVAAALSKCLLSQAEGLVAR